MVCKPPWSEQYFFYSEMSFFVYSKCNINEEMRFDIKSFLPESSQIGQKNI